MKDVKKLLKSQKDKILPDESVKRAIAADLGVTDSQSQSSFRSGGAAVKVKRNIAITVAAVAAVALTAASVAIWLNSRDGTEFIPSREFQFGTVSSATDFYAYGAVSMGGLLSGKSTDSSLSVNSVVAASEEITLGEGSSASVGLSDEQKAKVEEYYVFATGMLGDGKISSSVVASDRAEYSYKLSADYADAFGTAAEYVLYFNAKDDVKKDKYALEGVLIVGGSQYPVEGKYQSESDSDETENEISFKAFTSVDKKSYVSLKYETEISDDEIETGYTVKVIEDGKQVEKASVSCESEEGKTTFEISIKREDGDVKLEFEGFDEGVMGVTADFGGEKHQFGMTHSQNYGDGGFQYDWDFKGYSDKYEPEYPYEDDKEDKYEPEYPYEDDKEDKYEPEYPYGDDKEDKYEPEYPYGDDKEDKYEPEYPFGDDKEDKYEPEYPYGDDKQ
ncbi:MAG: hypothetical protein ACI4MH_07725 [Candidatus Coproplasma sp.]